MRLEAVRIIADWLLNASFGVNTYIPLVPKDAADAAVPLISAWTDPATAQVSALAVFDETRHAWAGNRLVDAPATPGLTVFSRGRLLVEGEPTPDGQIRRTMTGVQVGIMYQTADSDLARAITNGDYVLRAVQRSLRELSKNANEGNRKRNGVLLQQFEDPMELYPIVEAVGETYVAGVLLVNCKMRDYNPSF